MSQSFKCKLCRKSIIIEGNNASALLEHIKTSHPEIKIPDSITNETEEDIEEAKRRNKLHIPKNNLDKIKEQISERQDSASLENISQNSEDNQHTSAMDKTTKTSESKSEKSPNSATKLLTKDNRNNSAKMNAGNNDDKPLHKDVVTNKSNASSQDLNNKGISKNSGTSADKKHTAKSENPRPSDDSTNDVFYTPRASIELPTRHHKKDEGSKDKDAKSHTSKSKSDDLETKSKAKASKGKDADQKNDRHSTELPTKDQKDSKGSGDEAANGKPKQNSKTRDSNAALGKKKDDNRYSYSVEKWKPGNGKISCPKCGSSQRPTVRSRACKVSDSPLGAACILTCWPLCFLPCLFPPPAQEFLYCSVCNHLLGVYDRKTGSVQPNNEKLERRESQKSVKVHPPLKEVPDFSKESAAESAEKKNKTSKQGDSKK